MSWPDEETFLPPGDHYILNALCEKAAVWVDSYNAMHALMLSNGWTFEDRLYDGLGSNEKLVENAEAYYGPTFFTEIWQNEEWHIPWLLPVPDHVRTPIADVYLHYWGETPVLWDKEAWMASALGLPAFLSPEGRFKTGLAIRQAVRFSQLRVAKCVEMIFCLDNRGRPRLE